MFRTYFYLLDAVLYIGVFISRYPSSLVSSALLSLIFYLGAVFQVSLSGSEWL